MYAILRQLRHAARTLARTPGFTVAATLTLAIGIGAVTAVFALANAIVLRPLPYPDAQQLVAVGHAAPALELEGSGLSDGTFLHYRRHGRAFSSLAMYHESVVNLGDEDGTEAERVPVAVVTHDLFAVLGARTAQGRLPAAADADGSGERVVLLSHELWQRRYGGDPTIVGGTIAPNRVPRRVIGILEPGFTFPHRDVGIWFPSDPDPSRARASDLINFGVGRLAPGFDAAAAARDLDRLLPTLPEVYPDLSARVLADSQLRAVVTPLQEVVVGGAGEALGLLLAGMGLLLLIACANVANLVLLRGEHRRKEMAVRAALGAGRRELAGVVVAETLVLGVLGGAFGLVLAAAAIRALVAVGGAGLPRLDEIAIDERVAAVALGLALVTAVLVALLPARLRRSDVAVALRESGAGTTAGVERQRTRRLLVTAQVALALTLLVASALLAQSFSRLTRARPGFTAAGVLTAELALPRSGYDSYAATQQFWEALLARVEGLPGVTAAGMVSGLPLVPQPAYHDLAIAVEDRPDETRAAVSVYHVTPGYFAAMSIPPVAGQPLGAETAATGERPVLLSAAAAHRLFPGRAAVGRRIRRAVGEAPWATVVGVVADVPREQIGGRPAEIVYLPVLPEPPDPELRPSYGALVVRSSVAPATLAAAVRSAVRELDPHLPLADVRTMETIVADSAARLRFVMLLLGVAAVAALALGSVGLYGVLSYVVDRRSRELSIRLALGARRADVRNAVVRETLALAAGGIVVGLVTTAAVTRFLRGLLYEVSPGDPRVFAAMAALVLGVSLLAGWLPARRAVRADPVAALRGE